MARGNELAARILDGVDWLMERQTRFSTVRTVQEGVAVAALAAASLITDSQILRVVIEETDSIYRGEEYG